MASERNIILKSWSTLEDDVIIKEVATKGKYIQMCISFISKRNRIQLEEARDIFYFKVHEYVHRVIINRQVFKAEHILKNISESPKYVLYEMQDKFTDPSTKSYIIDHLTRTNEDFINEIPVLDGNLFLIQLIRENSQMVYEYDNMYAQSELKLLTLNKLYQKDINWRNKISVHLFFKLSHIELRANLDKHHIWKYLLERNDIMRISQWLECEEVTIEMHENKFENQLVEIFNFFTIESDMLKMIDEYPILNSSDVLLNSLARGANYFVTKEQESTSDFLNRLALSETFDGHRDKLRKNEIITDILNEFIKRENYFAFYEIFNHLYRDISIAENIQNNVSTDIILRVFKDSRNMLELSKEISQYIIVNKDPEFYEKNSFIQLFENSENYDTILSKFNHYNNFIISYNKVYSFQNRSPAALLQAIIKNYHQHVNFTELMDNGIPHFGDIELYCNSSESLKCTYAHHLQQSRGSCAIYSLFIEHLKHYAKITKDNIQYATFMVTELSLNNITDLDIVCHCIGFIEMLGYQTINLRAKIKTMRMLVGIKRHLPKPITPQETIDAIDIEIGSGASYADFSAILKFCDIYNLSYPLQYLVKYAKSNDWRNFFLYIQTLKYPLNTAIQLIQSHFTCRVLGINIARAIGTSTNVTTHSQKFTKKSNMFRSTSLSDREQITSQIIVNCISNNSDLFSVLLMSSNWCKLNLNKDLDQFKWPILAVLASCFQSTNLIQGWAYWLKHSINCDQHLENLEQESIFELIEFCVLNGFVKTLHDSVDIFFPHLPLHRLTKYLYITSQHAFCEETDHLLQEFLSLRQKAVLGLQSEEVIVLTDMNIKALLIHHLIKHFSSNYNRLKVLASYCDAEMIYGKHFVEIRHILLTVEGSKVEIDLADFYDEINYEILIEKSMDANEFQCALALAQGGRGRYDKEIIIFRELIYLFNDQRIPFDLSICKEKVQEHALSAEYLVSLYMQLAAEFDDARRYLVLKAALDTIKKFKLYPNAKFDRDRIEYEMMMCYILESEDTIPLNEELIYHSEFYENEILTKGEIVITKTFMELKEIAGINELTVCSLELTVPREINRLECLILRLLDDGDIVEALRLQAIFQFKPPDLHFIVFCMALAENLANIYNLSRDERQLLSGGIKPNLIRFNRRILRSNYPSSSSPSSSTASPPKTFDMSDNAGEFEEIPPREKQDVLEALQGIVSRLNHGVRIGERIIMIYRAAMYLDRKYTDILTNYDVNALLNNVVKADCFNKLVVINDIMLSMRMTSSEIVQFIGDQIATSIIKSRFYLLQNANTTVRFNKNFLWEYDLDHEFHCILDLCTDSIQLGNYLLQYCDGLRCYRKNDEPLEPETVMLQRLREIMENQVLSYKKHNIISVELLIKAHDCFVKECYMEGIVVVLQKAKILNNYLAAAKSWNLIVRMLIGIARYREMYYCFDTLIKNEQFESLLGQFDEQYANGLKVAIISYLHEHHPENLEYYRLTALHFCMYTELAEMSENEARTTVAKILSKSEKLVDKTLQSGEILKIPYLITDDKNIISELTYAIEKYANASENYLLDNKLQRAQKTASSAELIALQTGLVRCTLDEQGNISQSLCVLNIQTPSIFRYMINYELSASQIQILIRSCHPFEINWAEVLYIQYVVRNKVDFFQDFLSKLKVTDKIAENIVKMFQNEKISKTKTHMEEAVINIVKSISSMTTKYKLASLLGFKDIIWELINDQSLYYLKDTEYGRNKI